MGIIEIILIAIGLSMDAVCVSMSNGMAYNLKTKKAFLVGGYFGVFQGVMPLIGYYVGSIFSKQIEAYDHIIALVLLVFIGGKMIFDAFKNEDEDNNKPTLSNKMLLLQAIATSIDALAIGVSFSAMQDLQLNILTCVLIIAFTTFILSFVAVKLGVKIGTKLNKRASIFGGCILILIGLKIFIEHTIG
ncbi:MAG: manganese efflux pump MntP family protein [Oscillospiraceae bacterium]